MLVALAIGLVGLGGLYASMGQPAAIGGAIAAASMALGSLLTWYAMRRTNARSIRPMSDSMESLAMRDVVAVIDEFANRVEGGRARQIEVHADPVPVPSDPELKRLAEALNTTIARLESGAHQISAMQHPSRRHFYVGPDDYLLGNGCAEAMSAMLPGGGPVLLMTPGFAHAGIDSRRRGFESSLRERSSNLYVIGTVESRFDHVRTAGLVMSFINAHPGLAGIYCAEAGGVTGCVEALTELNLLGKVVVICHDTLDQTMIALSAGQISATMSQDPFGQGYETPIHLFNHVATGWMPKQARIITESSAITRDNYPQYWQPTVGTIESAAMAERRARPMAVSQRPLRIAMLGVGDSQFWEPVKAGVIAASRTLADFNATAEWIVPEGRRGFLVSVRGPAIEQLVRDGYAAIATPVYDAALVPYLNRAVDLGVAVATFNSEGTSLQGLIASLSMERSQLQLKAGDLELVARRDPLTGAHNRRSLDEDLIDLRRSVAATKQPAAVVMIDLDHFKAYNDTYGHAAGDDVLRMVTRRIETEIRPTDRVYRYGGEEFIVAIKEACLDEGEAVATRIAQAIADLAIPHLPNQPWGVVTVSAGVAELNPLDCGTCDCVGNADAALYRSKASGRNAVTTAAAA